LPHDAKYYFTKATVERALDENILFNEALSNGLNGKKFNNVKSAIESALAEYKENDLIIISGSTFVVADAFVFFNLS
jgi:dihydrofolate synthase/folylpolyglutamate synthase